MERREFISTESRFLQIFSLLNEIRDNSTTDVEARITQLEQDRDRLRQEIDQIRQTGVVEGYNRTQIQEWSLLANEMARQLIADFAEVKQNFRDPTRTVQEAQLKTDAREYSVVGHILDADEELKKSDQGRNASPRCWNMALN